MADLAAGIAWSVPQESQRGSLHSGMGLGASSRPGKAGSAKARAAIAQLTQRRSIALPCALRLGIRPRCQRGVGHERLVLAVMESFP